MFTYRLGLHNCVRFNTCSRGQRDNEMLPATNWEGLAITLHIQPPIGQILLRCKQEMAIEVQGELSSVVSVTKMTQRGVP